MHIKLNYSTPISVASASAYTTHRKQLVYPEEMDEEKSKGLLELILNSGHHSVYEQVNLNWTISGITRAMSFELCEIPHTSIEQQSQRVVKLDDEAYYIPEFPMLDLKLKYQKLIKESIRIYNEIGDILKRDFDYETWKKLGIEEKKIGRFARGKALENARYVLPIAMETNMYYSMNWRTFLQMMKTEHVSDIPSERHKLMKIMKKQLSSKDKSFEEYFLSPLESWPEKEYYENSKKSENYVSRWEERVITNEEELIPYALKTLYPNTVPSEEILNEFYNPAFNIYLNSEMDEGNITPFGSIGKLTTPAIGVVVSISAGHQFIRNRAIAHVRQSLLSVPVESIDIITPRYIRNNEDALEKFNEAIEILWDGRRELLDEGVSLEIANYLLPNATAIRYLASSNFLGWWHFLQQRMCLRAQDEIREVAIKVHRVLNELYPEKWENAGPICKYGECKEKEPALECIPKLSN